MRFSALCTSPTRTASWCCKGTPECSNEDACLFDLLKQGASNRRAFEAVAWAPAIPAITTRSAPASSTLRGSAIASGGRSARTTSRIPAISETWPWCMTCRHKGGREGTSCRPRQFALRACPLPGANISQDTRELPRVWPPSNQKKRRPA